MLQHLLMTGTTCMVVPNWGVLLYKIKSMQTKYCFTFPEVGTGITKTSQSFYYSKKKVAKMSFSDQLCQVNSEFLLIPPPQP